MDRTATGEVDEAGQEFPDDPARADILVADRYADRGWLANHCRVEPGSIGGPRSSDSEPTHPILERWRLAFGP